jgi:intein/homing endonuclease
MVGLETLAKCRKFSDGKVESSIHLEFAQQQEIRWIVVESVEIVSREKDEEFVYDLSIPGSGTEKFVAGSCPVLVHNSEEKMRMVISQVEAIAPCVVGDTLIKRAGFDQPAKIEEVYQLQNHLLPAPIETVDEDGKRIESLMYGILRKPLGDRKLLKIELASGHSITVTDNHKLLVRSDNFGLVWIEAKDLEEGMDIVEISEDKT